jgi:hypothetical protein
MMNNMELQVVMFVSDTKHKNKAIHAITVAHLMCTLVSTTCSPLSSFFVT